MTICIHPTARLGFNTYVWNFTTIAAHVVTGADCVIGSNVFIGEGSILGDGVRIQHGAFLPRGSVVGHRVFIGPNVTMTDDKYPRVGNIHYDSNPPILEDDCAIGAGAVLLPGVRIGKGALVGAGAVVTQSIPAGSVVKGLPAKEQVA